MPRDDALASCRWPALAEPYATALREAVAYIFERWEPIGIIASGTIVRGTPSRSSDLDLYVLHERPERQRVQRRFAGVPAELFVNPPERVERYFETDRRDGRPISAHMIATGFVVYDADPRVERLRRLAAEALATPPSPSPIATAQRRYTAASSFEDAEDIAADDPEMCVLLLHNAVAAAIEYRFWTVPQWQPRSKDTLTALQALDAPLAATVRAFYRTADPIERLRLARQIVETATGESGFFEWESEVEWLER